MSTYYQFLGTDLDNLLEPYDGDHPSPDFTNYEINGTSMVGRFAGSTRTWEKTFSGGGYYYNGTLIKACFKGYKPSIWTVVHEIGGDAGGGSRDYTITRSDSYLTLTGTTTESLNSSAFRNNKVPMCIGLMFCGGGGGGTDNGSGSGDSSWGGGGGGMALCVLSFDGLTDTVTLHLGEGGGFGTSGGASYLSVGGSVIVRAGGGQYRGEAYDIYGGWGGEAGRLVNSHPNVNFISGVKGGDGVSRWNTTSPWPGCPFNVKITERDSIRAFGCPSGTAISSNSPYGGPSLNGAYVSQETSGTNGGGGGARHDKNGNNGSGGAGKLYIFY